MSRKKEYTFNIGILYNENETPLPDRELSEAELMEISLKARDVLDVQIRNCLGIEKSAINMEKVA